MKTLNLSFNSVFSEEIQDYSGDLILTTRKESPKKCEKLLLHEDILEYSSYGNAKYDEQKLNLDFEEDDLILGVDLRQRKACQYFTMGLKLSSVYTSIEKFVYHLIGILSGLGAKSKTLKIGDGNMEIANDCHNA